MSESQFVLFYRNGCPDCDLNLKWLIGPRLRGKVKTVDIENPPMEFADIVKKVTETPVLTIKVGNDYIKLDPRSLGNKLE